jgi:hypothetical protein
MRGVSSTARRAFGAWAAIILLSGCRAGSSDASTPVLDARLTGSTRLDRNGWVFVHLEGPPDQIGFQHGYLLTAEIGDLLRVTKPLLLQLTKRDWPFYRQAAETILWPKIEPEYRQELDGIVAGVAAHGGSVDRWDIVALNAIEELAYYYVPMLDKQAGKAPTVTSPESCSAFVATGAYTRDHRIVMGHNAWTDYIVGSRWNMIFDLTPAHGQRILMDGLPGVIVSDDDFDVTSAGLMVTETTITKFEGFDPAGTPEFVRARKALQYGASIDDFVRIMLDGNNGGYANDWLIGDNKTGEVARFELGLKFHTVERTSDGYFVGSNFPVGDDLRQQETTFDATNAASSPNARHTRWDQVMAQFKGQIDEGIARQLESDAYDIVDKKKGPNERTLCGTVETSPRGIPDWDWPAYFPGGTVQAKVTTGAMAEAMTISAAAGHPCGHDFIAADFLAAHPAFAWAKGLLRDMKIQPWTTFTSGMKP